MEVVVGGQKTRFKRHIWKAFVIALLLIVTAVPYALLETFHELHSTGGVNDHSEGYILEEQGLEEKREEGITWLSTALPNTYSDERISTRPLPASRLVDIKTRLNGLVEASVAASNQQLCNLAFLKTHKTGSTTLAGLFYRYGVRHGRKVAKYNNGRRNNGKPLPIEEAFPKILREAGGRVDIMHYHIGTSNNLTCTWKAAEDYYRRIMRDPRRINFVTILREPREHLLSYYYYFIRHRVRDKSISEFFGDPQAQRKFTRLLNNTLAGELGVKDSQDLRHFSSVILPGMKLVFLTDRFDEGLMLLRILMGWHMIDMTYVALNVNTSGNMTPLLVVTPERQHPKGTAGEEKRPHFDDLPQEVQDSVDELTQLDRAVYEAGKIEFEKTLAPYARSVEADMKEFRRLQAEVQKYLEVTSPSLANDL